MRTITRTLAGLVLFLGLAGSVQAQNPAVKMKAGPPPELISYTLQNLGAGTITVNAAVLMVFDAKTCKRLCVSRSSVNKRIIKCNTLDGQIRCPQTLPQASGYIYYLKILHSGGQTENWLYVP
ncbi:MAG TPA: hypothetical protein VFB82_06225 [Blastocatellia bacterium]|nr:hypothetical protein [Blastocatellia bacterium]